MSEPANLVQSVRTQDKALVLSLKGEIDLYNSPELRTQVLDLMARHQPSHVVLNLALVPYMDSSAIAVLVETLQKMRRSGGKVSLVQPQPRVKGLLEIARLDSIFKLAASEDEAVAGVK